MKLLARCIRGIEWLLAAEVRGLGAEVVSIGHRALEFSLGAQPSESQLRLGCADDVFLVVGELRGIDHRRASLSVLGAAAARLPVEATLATLRSLRGAPLGGMFTVVASFLGSRNYNRYAVEDAVAQGIARATGLVYESSRDGSPERPVLVFRVHLLDDSASFSLRVFQEPLHRRGYKQRSYPGTLHPPLARAMAMLAGLAPQASVLDPFCGVGTALIEAALLERSARYCGVDIDTERVSATRENAGLAGVRVEVAQGDAASLPFEAATFTRVVTNLPWGLAVEPEGRLRDGPAELLWAELARVLRPDGRAVILTDKGTALATAAKHAELQLLLRSRVSLFGQHPELWLLGAAGVAKGTLIEPSAPFGPQLLENLPLAERLPLDFGVAG